MTPVSPMQPVSNPSDACAPKTFSSAEIDASCRGPVLFLFFSATVWLVLGSLLAVVNSVKLHAPYLLSGCSLLTYGRLQPAQLDAFLYGFASQAAMGIVIWLLCQLGRTALARPVYVTVSALFWNLGVTLGIGGILAGDVSGHEWFDFPGYASPILFVAFVVFATVAIMTFHGRRDRETYPSQWYLLAAVFILPWILSTAAGLLICHPVRGVMQVVVTYWFANSFLTLWLGSVALAAIYYFIPKITGRPLYSYHLAALCFWSLVIFGGWAGIPAGAPLPRWMSSVSAMASLLLLVPVLGNVVNWRLTRGESKVTGNMTFCFIGFGVFAYLISSLAKAGSSLRLIADVTDFTLFTEGLTQFALYGFIAMTFIGAIYYIVPRLTSLEWPCTKSPKITFWCGAIGILIFALAFGIGGIVQGKAINDPGVGFLDVVKRTFPFIGMSTLGLLLIFVANFALLTNFLGLFRSCARACCKCGSEKGEK